MGEWTFFAPTQSCYRKFSGNKPVTERQEDCHSLNTTVVTNAGDMEEMDFIKTIVEQSQYTYIGATDEETEGKVKISISHQNVPTRNTLIWNTCMYIKILK